MNKSLPGLQALIEQKIEHWRAWAAAPIDDVDATYRPHALRQVLTNCANELSALLVVQGGVQQDEKDDQVHVGVALVESVYGKDDPRSRCGSAAPEGQDLRDGTLTSDAPTPALDLIDVPLWIHEWCQRHGYPGGLAALGVEGATELVKCVEHVLTNQGKFARLGWSSPATARPTDGNSAQILSSERRTPDGPRDQIKAAFLEGYDAACERDGMGVPDEVGGFQAAWMADGGTGKWTAEQEVAAVKQQLPFAAWRNGASLARCVEDLRMDRDLYRGTLVGLLPVCDADGGELAQRVKRFIGQVIKADPAAHGGTAPHPEGEK